MPIMRPAHVLCKIMAGPIRPATIQQVKDILAIYTKRGIIYVGQGQVTIMVPIWSLKRARIGMETMVPWPIFVQHRVFRLSFWQHFTVWSMTTKEIPNV